MFCCKSLPDISLTETFPQVFACRYACASCPAFQCIVIRCRQFHGNTVFQFVGRTLGRTAALVVSFCILFLFHLLTLYKMNVLIKTSGMNLSLRPVVGASGFGLPETQTCSTKNQSPAILSSSEYALYKFGRNNTVPVSSYGGDRPVFPFLFIMYFLIFFAISRYISE